VVVYWTQVPVTSPGLYQGGLALHALAIVLVVFAVARPGLLRAVTAFEPLRQLGLISYGVYLYHWPIFLWLSPARTGLEGWELFGLRIGVTLFAAVASYVLVERPIRSGVRLAGRPGLVTAPIAALVIVVGALSLPSEPQTLMESASFGAEVDPFASLDLEIDRAGEVRPDVEAAGTDESGPIQVPVPRIAVFGDSTVVGPFYGLLQVDTTTGEVIVVPGRAVLGCGLARTPWMRSMGREYPLTETCASWPEEWAAAIAEHEPDIAVVLFGPWDASDRKLEGDDTWRAVGDPAYDAFAAMEIRAALELLTERVDLVVWLTSPPIDQSMNQLGGPPDPASNPERLIRWNELVAAEIDRYPDTDAVMVDLRSWFDNLPEGPFDPVLRPDGVHIADDQAPRVGGWLADQIIERWHARAVELAGQGAD
jgi:hypothetical protein